MSIRGLGAFGVGIVDGVVFGSRRNASRSPFLPCSRCAASPVQARFGSCRSSSTLLSDLTFKSELQNTIILLRSTSVPLSIISFRATASAARTRLTSCATSARRFPDPEEGTKRASRLYGSLCIAGERSWVNGVDERRGSVLKRWTREGGRVAVQRIRLVAGRVDRMCRRMTRISSAKSGPVSC